MIKAEHLSIRSVREGRLLIDDLSFVVNPGERVAVIGEEGNGKSTLLRALAGLPLPSFSVEGHLEAEQPIGYLEQDIKSLWGRTGIADYLVLLTPNEAKEEADYNLLAAAGSVFSRLGLPATLWREARPLASFSGGEVVKLGLAKILLRRPRTLFLDEPSNDLDLATMDFLQRFLLQVREPLVFVSHDVSLLSETATGIIHLEQWHGRKSPHTTYAALPYARYLERHSSSLDKQETLALKGQENLKAKEEKWRHVFDQVRYAQNQAVRDPTTGRLLKKKMKALLTQKERFARTKAALPEVPEKDVLLHLFFDEGSAIPSRKRIVSFHGPLLAPDGRLLASALSLEVIGPEKIAIVGKNGSGKSTLLKALKDQLASRKDLSVGYMPQDYAETMGEEETALDFLAEKGDEAERTKNRERLGALLFTREEMAFPLARLSGGEKAKLLLLSFIVKKANVLLLDEPTRNLSPNSAPRIHSLLRSFAGTLIAVSHDRVFLAACFERFYELTPEGLSPKENL